MDGKSLTPQEIKLQQLKKILPEAFVEGKIDWEKLKATLSEDINFLNERYVLNWAGKSEAFKVLQTPTTKTLVPDKKESVNFNETEHIFIEGENLEVLKVLQKSYFGKVKMIYIDPPYNTGNDSFIYSDKFSETRAEYEKRVGDKDENGYLTKDGFFKKNSKENGQYHSNWLNMMYPRMFLAKNLLKQDGVIFVSIDDNEVHNFRLLMNEVFGEENFVAEIPWQARQSIQNDIDISSSHEYILVYAKVRRQTNRRLKETNKAVWYKEKSFACFPLPLNKSKFSNPDNDIRGLWKADPFDAPNIRPNLTYSIKNPNTDESYLPPYGRCWRMSEKDYQKLLTDNRIVFGKTGKSKPQLKVFYEEKKKFGSTSNTWFDGNKYGTATKGTKQIQKLFKNSPFDTPKPIELIKHLLILSTKSNDISLDFFSGSATTAHAVMQLNAEDGGNRKCISVQLPELCDEKSEAHKAGYKTIADIAKERIRRAGKKIQEEINDKIKTKRKEIKELESQLYIDGKEEKIKNLKAEIEKLKQQDLGFKVLKLSDSNFKQWQQIKGNDALSLEKQMDLFIDPVSENATIENMVYELLLKSGKDLNSKLKYKDNYYSVNDNELILMLEKATQEIVDALIKGKPQKVIALDRLFKGNDQLKTNTSFQMKDVKIEFKTI
ncbi:MAG: site-specific DNA-methyltransferase [Desulfobacteraceae bacterium 4572_130]|nr:MAG: site-specific DNA-methyltransferase [Desulfobacteraceae bacterium 4572_130]